MNIGIIGGGISGVSVAKILSKSHQVTVFEKESSPGGLIRCKYVDGNLYHLIGGHVFNSKNPRVMDWFWSHFDQEEFFLKVKRNSKIKISDKLIDYPIENHIYQLG